MRDQDSFAFGPGREKRPASASPPANTSRAPRSRIGSGIAAAPLLLLASVFLFAVAWTSLAIVASARVALRLHAWVVRRSGIGRVVAKSGRAVAMRGATVARTLRSSTSAQSQLVRRTRRLVKSRRASASVAFILTILILGGVVPVHATTGTITTVAGRPDAGDGGAATSALMQMPEDVAADSSGNIYIADTFNHRIRKVSTTGTITTVAGNGTSGFSGDGGAATSAQLRFPAGIAVDAAGNLYIADVGNQRIRKVNTSGNISTFAGTGVAGFSGDGGAATAAQLNSAEDIATDAAGNVYIADRNNHRIRKVSTAGIITTFAGNGIEGFAGDGAAATAARLNDPSGVAVSATGIVYIADRDNERVRKVTTDGKINKFAGSGTAGFGGDGGSATASGAKLRSPEDVSVDSTGQVFIADQGNDRIRKVNTALKIFTVAGSATSGFSGDGGPATAAALNDPTGIAAGPSGNLYIADSSNNRIRHVNSTGTITTYAGKDHFGGDGGPATDASLNFPLGITADGSGNLFIADYGNNRIRRVSAGGVMTTIAGNGVQGSAGDGGAATSANLGRPADVAVDTAGNVYVADSANNKIRKVDAGGTITTIAGTGTAGFSGDGGAAAAAKLNDPIGVEVDAANNLYIADFGNHRIRKVTPAGIISTIAGNGTGSFCGDGGAATSACLRTPTDVSANAAGDLFIADYGNNRIRKVTAGTIRTVAGNGFPFTFGDGGQATSAGVSRPVGVDVDAAGNIFIAESMGGRIRRVALNGIITTVGGTGAFGFSGDGGPAVSAEMAFPARVALNANGDFFIADTYNNRIRMVEGLGMLPGPTLSATTPASPANNNDPVITGSAALGTTVTIYTDSNCTGSVAATGTDTDLSGPGIAVNVPGDSTTSFYATSTDGTGRVSACSMTPLVYIEDSTAPAAPNISSPPASPANNRTPSWGFTTEAGATTQCELRRGGTIVSAYAPCTSPATYDLTSQPDGQYHFRVFATDAAGNAGNVSLDNFDLDTFGPAVPTITASPTDPSSDDTPSWSFTVEAGSTGECELRYGGAPLQADAPCTSPATYDLTAQPDGDYTFRVWARDGANNLSAAASNTYTLDTDPPAAPTITQSPTTPGNSTAPSWSFTAELGSLTECELQRGGLVVSAWASCSSPKIYDLAGDPDGDYDFFVRATDAAGNTGPSTTDDYLLDTTGPDVSITASPSTPDSDPSPSWSFTTAPGATTECELRRSGVEVSPWTACAGSKSYNLTIDGAYAFSVRATDAIGNTGDQQSSEYTLDTQAPEVTITSAPAPVSSEQYPSWDFETEAGATTECELTGPLGVFSPYGPCSDTAGYDLSNEPDGLYTLSIRATDQVGNLGSPAVSSYTLDTTGPIVGITSSPASPDNDTSPSWGFSANPGNTTQCELTGPSGVVSAYAPCTSPAGYNLTDGDGAYTFSVRATDGAGNVGAPASDTYTLDVTPPAAPTITSAPPSPDNSVLPSWSFTADAGSSTECELSHGGAPVSAWTSCSTPETYDLSSASDGDYTFKVRATDDVGNTGPVASDTYQLDTTGPSVSITPPTSPDNDRTPTWNLSTEAGAILECQLSDGAGVIQPYALCSDPATYDLSAWPDGGYTIQVRATDGPGNTGPVASSTYELDTTGPTTTIVGAPTTPGNVTNPSWSFTTEAGATTQCELSNGAGVVHPFAPCSSPKSYDVGGQPDGDYTFRVRATDAVGNTGANAADTYTLDTTPPAVPIITSAPADPGSDTTPTWSFTATAGATVECELSSGATVLQPYASCASPRTYDIGTQPDGDYTFRVRATDALGNSSVPAVGNYTLDTVLPTVAITAEPTSPGNLSNPTWAFTTEAGATTECELSRGGTPIYPSASCTSPMAYNLTGELDDTYVLRVRATDAAGNLGPAVTSSYELDTIAPVVTITAGPGATGSGTSPAWSFTTEAGATTECRLMSGGTSISPWASCSSPKTFDLAGKPDGDYTFQVRATDQAGNTGTDAADTYALAAPLPPPPPEAPDGGGRDGNGGNGGNGNGNGNGNGDGDAGTTEPPAQPTQPTEAPTDPTAPESSGAIDPFVAPYSIKDGKGHHEKSDRGDEGDVPVEVAPAPEEVIELVTESPSLPAARGGIARFIDSVSAVAGRLLEQPAFPLALLAVAFGFLLLQNRIDRKDPKLALAPVYADPHLYFEGSEEDAQASTGKDR